MKLAVFNDNSKIPGKELRFEGNSFIIEGVGTLTIEQVLALDESLALSWEPGVQEKIYSFYKKTLPVASSSIDGFKESPLVLEGLEAPESKNSSSKKNKILVLTLVVVAAVALLAGGIFFLIGYLGSGGDSSNGTAEKLPDSTSPAETAEFAETTTTPKPLEYNFDEDKASDVINGYISSISSGDYAVAYGHVYFPQSSESSSATPQYLSKESWVSANEAAGYTISTETTSAVRVSVDATIDSENEKTLELNELASARVSNLFEGEIPFSIVLHWNRNDDTYKIEDRNAFFAVKDINKTFSKKTDLTTASVVIEQAVVGYGKTFITWDYNDNGSAQNVNIVFTPGNTSATLQGQNADILTVWRGAKNEWSLPQDVKDNLFRVNIRGSELVTPSSMKIDLDIKREAELILPSLEFQF